MKKESILIYIFIFFIFNGFSQSDNRLLDTIVLLQKRFKILAAEQKLKNLKNKNLKTLFYQSLQYRKTGEIGQGNKGLIKNLKGRNLIIGSYLLANNISLQEKGQDSLVFELYKKSYKLAIKSNDTLLINEILIRLNWHLFTNLYKYKIFKKYVNQLENFKKDNIDNFYAIYYEIGLKMYEIDIDSIKTDSLWFEKKFKKAERIIKDNYFLGKNEHLKSIFYSAYLKNLDLALLSNDKAIEYFKKNTLFFSNYMVTSINFNKATDYVEQRKYKKAIPIFLRNQKVEKNMLYKMYGYDWLYKCYEGLKKGDSAYYFFKKMITTKDSLNQLKHARSIKSIESKYNLKEKEKELKIAATENKTLKTKMNTILPILAIITLLLGIVFILYKKYHKKTEVLEEEKSETIKKIDELKQIVIKNHIILKDKTKVYIADLTHIKSDDHYLKVFLSNGKNHFVRGKLNKIIEELPPNFIRCHRSYVVNRNFIKQINSTNIILVDKTELPLSRSFKNKF